MLLRCQSAAALAVLSVLSPLAQASVAERAAPTSQSPRPAQLAPQRGALLGAWVDNVGHWVDEATAKAAVTRLEGQIGRKLDVDQHYYGWTDSFPTGLESWDAANGRIPLVSWGGTALGPVLSGAYDSMIRARARSLRALDKPVFLRFGWEMNGNWSPYDGTHANTPGTTDGPGKYIQAWRRIHSLFDAEGATNVVWVWCPNATDVPAQPWNHWSRYYPGDAFVDWVGVDAYNWGTTHTWSSWTSLASTISGIYADYGSRKPIMVAETASTEQGGDKSAWIRSLRSTLKTRFPSIAALVYFDQAKETSWQVDSSPPSLAAFRGLANDPYFNR